MEFCYKFQQFPCLHAGVNGSEPPVRPRSAFSWGKRRGPKAPNGPKPGVEPAKVAKSGIFRITLLVGRSIGRYLGRRAYLPTRQKAPAKAARQPSGMPGFAALTAAFPYPPATPARRRHSMPDFPRPAPTLPISHSIYWDFRLRKDHSRQPGPADRLPAPSRDP